MIYVMGDIHGDYWQLEAAIIDAERDGAAALIQVGDFGMFPNNAYNFHHVCKDRKIPIYFIDGNHDDCSRWVEYDTVHQVWDDANLFYVPRGTVMEIDGRTIAFMGGAASIDKHTRLTFDMHWDERENINVEEIARMHENATGKIIDLFITHCPPSVAINENFNPLNKLYFGVGVDWTDPNQQIIEDLWTMMNRPMIISGHMHRNVRGEDYRIIDINKVIKV